MCTTGVRKLGAIKELVWQGDFRKLWGVGIVTGSMRWLEVLAIGIYTFEISGSAFTVALMLFARTFPGVAFGAIMGTLASRYRRRHLLILGMTIATVNALIMLILAQTNQLSLAAIAIAAAISGSIWTLEHPVRRTLLGDVAKSDQLQQAMSLDQLTVNGTRLVGPLVGGVVYATLGLIGIYALSVIGFAIASVLAFRTAANPPKVTDKGESFTVSLIQGLRYIRTRRVLRGILLLTIIANFFGFSYVTMVPVIGRELLALDPIGIGILQSMEGVGAVLVAILLAGSSRTFPFARSCTVGGITFLALLLVFSLSPWFWLSCVALFVAGVGIGCFGTMQSTTILNDSDPLQRMRVMGVLVMCIGAAPAGVLTIGALADWKGPGVALLIMAGSGLIASAFCVYRYPELLQ